jgi:hypothetical protein
MMIGSILDVMEGYRLLSIVHTVPDFLGSRSLFGYIMYMYIIYLYYRS